MKNNVLRLRNFSLPVGARTLIMGVLNITPDSFSDGGKYLNAENAILRAKAMRDEGADIIDVGGESTRPGAETVSANVEMERVLPVVKVLSKEIGLPVSIDTTKSEVAEAALMEGASLVNDVTGLRGDRHMAGTVARYKAGVILMHMKGIPRTMQVDPSYDDVIGEIMFSLSDSIKLALAAGIKSESIIIDPGIGFGKTMEHNLVILRELGRFKKLEKPILIGTSRKSFIGEITGKAVDERAFGTAASLAAAIMGGARIVRVHDVNDMRDATRVADAIIR